MKNNNNTLLHGNVDGNKFQHPGTQRLKLPQEHIVRHAASYLVHTLKIGLDLLLHLDLQLQKHVCRRCRPEHVVLERGRGEVQIMGRVGRVGR